MRSPSYYLRSINLKLLLLLVLPISLVFAGVLRYNYTISKELLKESVIENTENLTQTAIEKINQKIETHKNSIQTFAHRIGEYQLSPIALKNYQKQILKENRDILGSCVVIEATQKVYFQYRDIKDSLTVVELDTTAYDYATQDWYLIPKLTGKVWFSEPYYDHLGSNQSVCTYAIPMYRSEVVVPDSFYGIATIDLSLDWINTLLDDINLSDAAYAFLITQNGTFVAHPESKFVLNESVFSLARMMKSDSMYATGQKMASGQSGFGEIKVSMYRHQAYIYYAPIESLQWSMGVVYSQELLFKPLNILTRESLTRGGIILVVLIVLMIIVAHRITRSLNRLASAAQEIGRGHFDYPLPQIHSRDEVGVLATSLAEMQDELKVYMDNLALSVAQQQKIESELHIAHNIQMSMVPSQYPAFPEREDIDIYGYIQPARDIGGDLFDYFFVDQDRLYLLIGDVAGKGVPAALFMAMTRTLIRSKTTYEHTPEEILFRINNDLAQDNPNAMFVTLFLGVFDFQTHKLTYSNAGHNAPYLIRGSEVTALPLTQDMPVGIFADVNYRSHEICLDASDILVFYTDGLSEAVDIQNHLFGEDRLIEALQHIDHQKNAKEILSDITLVQSRFSGEAEPADDLTLMVLKILTPKHCQCQKNPA